MHVGRVMTKDPVTILPDTSLDEAIRRVEERGVTHLLVINAKGKLVGILSDRDLKKATASSATTLSKHELNYLLDKLTVDSIMSKRIYAVDPSMTIERAATIMQMNKINALPVLEGDDLVGIVTTTDVNELLLQAIGIDTDSTRFTVLVHDRVGVMADICILLKDKGINIRSFVTWPEEEHEGLYQLVIRVPVRDGEKAASALSDAGFKVLTGYVEDLTPYLP